MNNFANTEVGTLSGNEIKVVNIPLSEQYSDHLYVLPDSKVEELILAAGLPSPDRSQILPIKHNIQIDGVWQPEANLEVRVPTDNIIIQTAKVTEIEPPSPESTVVGEPKAEEKIEKQVEYHYYKIPNKKDLFLTAAPGMNTHLKPVQLDELSETAASELVDKGGYQIATPEALRRLSGATDAQKRIDVINEQHEIRQAAATESQSSINQPVKEPNNISQTGEIKPTEKPTEDKPVEDYNPDESYLVGDKVKIGDKIFMKKIVFSSEGQKNAWARLEEGVTVPETLSPEAMNNLFSSFSEETAQIPEKPFITIFDTRFYDTNAPISLTVKASSQEWAFPTKTGSSSFDRPMERSPQPKNEYLPLYFQMAEKPQEGTLFEIRTDDNSSEIFEVFSEPLDQNTKNNTVYLNAVKPSDITDDMRKKLIICTFERGQVETTVDAIEVGKLNTVKETKTINAAILKIPEPIKI